MARCTSTDRPTCWHSCCRICSSIAPPPTTSCVRPAPTSARWISSAKSKRPRHRDPGRGAVPAARPARYLRKSADRLLRPDCQPMLRLTDLKLPLDHGEADLITAILSRLHLDAADLAGHTVAKRSHDARKRGA